VQTSGAKADYPGGGEEKKGRLLLAPAGVGEANPCPAGQEQLFPSALLGASHFLL
jgi:hypothetical protein